MDLALELRAGSVHQMMQAMPADELSDWWQYNQKRLLPKRRFELYLAQCAQVMVGGKLEDFLLRPAPASEEISDAEAFSEIAGGDNVYVLNVPRHPLQEQLDKFDREHGRA